MRRAQSLCATWQLLACDAAAVCPRQLRDATASSRHLAELTRADAIGSTSVGDLSSTTWRQPLTSWGAFPRHFSSAPKVDDLEEEEDVAAKSIHQPTDSSSRHDAGDAAHAVIAEVLGGLTRQELHARHAMADPLSRLLASR